MSGGGVERDMERVSGYIYICYVLSFAYSSSR